MKNNHNSIIVTQDQALSSYMDSLFGESLSNDLEDKNSDDMDSSIDQAKQQNNSLVSDSSTQNQTEIEAEKATISKQIENKSEIENKLEIDNKSEIDNKPEIENKPEVENKPEMAKNSPANALIDTSLNMETKSVIKPSIKQSNLPQQKNSVAVSEHEAPSLDLNLFLPNIPSTEELDIIEKKEQIQLNQQLQKELEKTKQTDSILKGQLQESLKKLDEYGKTHTEVYAPDWAQPSFQVMIFNVGNLKLALPLNDLNGIVVWDEKFINQMPGSVEWYLGIIQHLGKSVPVIDTLQQVIPPERVKSFMKKRGDFKNIIFIKDDSWGLVCEDIIGIKTLAVEEVKWRSNRTTRRWLYGTVKEYMCALLDTEEFASMLKTGKDSLIAGKTK